MNWAWWLPGTPPIPPAAGMFVQMMEYRHPVTRSKAVRFLACRRDGLVRRTIHRSPAGQRPARRIRWVISGSSRIACSSASVMAQPQVKSTWRRGVARDSSGEVKVQIVVTEPKDVLSSPPKSGPPKDAATVARSEESDQEPN